MKNLFFLLTLTSLLLTACGSAPTPDAEATAQTAIAVTQAAPDIQATVQAAVAATLTAQTAEMPAPQPTHTPIPFTHTPPPEPPTNTPVLEGATATLAPPPSITPGEMAPGACAYYVAPGGDDGNPGTEAQPWATFQHAAEGAGPGDTVCFRGGTYGVGEEIHLTRSGTADALITFIAYPGETPILDGGGGTGGLLILD